MDALVAMSGGVDSSVAAHLAATLYGPRNVWGVHMKLSENTSSCNINSRSCCSAKDALDAQSVAQKIGISFDEIDLSTTFHKTVIANFIDNYKRGRNAQPCMDCNYYLKFDQLVDLANRVGTDTKIVTGHYVRLDEHGLSIADDTRKDQSYYLWQISRELYSRLLFPLGEINKTEVRAMASKLGLITADKRDSQDICFIPNGDYREFLKLHLPEAIGEIRHQDGRLLGTHTGYWKFTIGQRRGLPINDNQNYYVARIDTTNNVIIVNDRPVTQTRFQAELNFTATNEQYFVKVRHGPALTECSIHRNTITTATPLVIAPGQAAVVYRYHNNRHYLVGGGYID